MEARTVGRPRPQILFSLYPKNSEPSRLVAAAPAVAPVERVLGPGPRARPNPPSYQQWMALPHDEQEMWECLVCCAPAIEGSWEPGRLCSSRCAFQKYYY
jgi:hypothetical protein